MNYQQAVEAYTETVEAQNGGQALQPRESCCSKNKQGRWALRNTAGFLAYVTSSGKVQTSNFQTI